jgi:integrase
VIVFAGHDPLSKRWMYLRETVTTEAAAKKALTRLVVQVDAQKHPKTRASFRMAMDTWLRTHDVEETTRASYEQYARVHLYPAFGDEPVSRVTTQVLEEFYAELRRCSARCDGRPFVEHRTAEPHECRVVKHKRPPGRPPAGGHPPHDFAETSCTVVECRPHMCVPLSPATIRRIHFAIRRVLGAAVRWGWITDNPAVIARKPRVPVPQPVPPTVAQAARIIDAAWAQDDDWGTLVWLVMVTGMRRAELLALRWSDVDLDAAVLTFGATTCAWAGARSRSCRAGSPCWPYQQVGARCGGVSRTWAAPSRGSAPTARARNLELIEDVRVYGHPNPRRRDRRHARLGIVGKPCPEPGGSSAPQRLPERI